MNRKTDLSGHTVGSVFTTMLWQICLDYSTGIPDVRSMTVDQIAFWYDGLRPTLRERTKRKT